MDYENKENHFKPRGNLFLEISAILIFVILILFAGVVFHFHTEVSRLYDDKAELLARIESFESRLGEDRNESDLSRLLAEQNNLRDQVSDLVKQIEATMAADFERRLEETQKRIEELEQRVQTVASARPQEQAFAVEKDARTKVINDIQVDLVGCAEKMMYVYCDVSLNNLGRTGRKVEVSNAGTLVADNNGNAYRISSFTLGTASEKEVRYKANVFVSKARPVNLRFRFYLPHSRVSSFAVVQFNVDGASVPFEQVTVDR
ncbi:hypothetical protein [Roseibium album]|uniref:Uncharacterized protein n=1 Tax=Roseibium album TaxID=311410 RepID=A0A0M6ZU24_9HYPH|nr:hypothetical protein [Roseibium album]CTQ60397.1 hypothetical protein LA5094_03170 [Roseibium album]CTQ66289.1 hypothetical protein LA5095_00799 [Roseibium album]CTQ74165.1 hypothetical protein LA5096_03939 [Roseibium album]